MRASRGRLVVAVTLVVAGVEWLLFELVRAPYRPPHDMRTLLGQEKYEVLGLMGLIAAGWSAFVLGVGLLSRPTARDWLAFAVLLGGLAAVAALVVRFPPWLVTPPELLFK